MNTSTFTVEEENLVCIFDTSSRDTLIGGIREAMPDFDEPELREIAENVLHKLETMSDLEFSAIYFTPAYFDDEED